MISTNYISKVGIISSRYSSASNTTVDGGMPKMGEGQQGSNADVKGQPPVKQNGQGGPDGNAGNSVSIFSVLATYLGIVFLLCKKVNK